MASSTSSPPGLTVVIAPDGLRADFHLAADVRWAECTDADVGNALKSAGLALTPQVLARCREFLTKWRSGKLPAADYLIAEGRPPTAPQDAAFCTGSTTGTDTAAPVGAPTDSAGGGAIAAGPGRPQLVAAGDILGCLTAPVPGEPGIDVRGREIPPRAPRSLELGAGVALAPDGHTVQAVTAGHFCLLGGRLAVNAVLEVAAVTADTGAVDAPADVLVHGEVPDGTRLRSGGSVVVEGAVGAAEVQAGGDVYIAGGIAGKLKGQVTAGSSITAKYCDRVKVSAGGDIWVAQEIVESDIHADGALHVAGVLVGGSVYARRGGEVDRLGSDGNVRTRLLFGPDPALDTQIAALDVQIGEQQKRISNVREKVAPLMSCIRRLSPQQREKVTEFLCQADELEVAVEQMLKDKEALVAQKRQDEPASMLITTMIYPGASIAVGDMTTTFTKPLAGPVRIQRSKVHGVEELVSVDPATERMTVLASRDYRLKSV